MHSQPNGFFSKLIKASILSVFFFAALSSNFTQVAALIEDNGEILPDSFLTSASLLHSPSSIQSFLDKKIGQCSNNSCINSYSENGLSAATLIYNAATNNDINPELLVAIIQAQTGLITDREPVSDQFLRATGHSCGDNQQACSFSNQVQLSAEYFAQAIATPNTLKYTLGTHSLPWHIDAECGTASLTIKNVATAAIYSYSQNFSYQPNAASIQAGYEIGNSCSSYGVRNLHNYAYDWFISPVVVPSDFPYATAYRFWSPQNQHHFYTSNLQEKNFIIKNYPKNIWTYEGIAFSVPNDNNCTQSTPVYRFWSNRLQGHFFTANAQEKNMVIATYDQNTWRYEGVAYCAFSEKLPGMQPVYRFWSNRLQGHFYTISTKEKNVILSTYDQNTWRYEGVAYYTKP